ncbi:MAG: glycine cleavage system protein H [Candidatus Hodarchaeales archaeon]
MNKTFKDYVFPDDRKYWINHTPSHLWLQELDDGSVNIGFTDFFQERIGELKTITLKAKSGTSCKTGKILGMVKAKNYSAILKYPLSGEINALNDKLIKKPKNVNKSPYDGGWFITIRPEPALNEQLTNNFVYPGEELETFIKSELKNDALHADDCCPDIIGGSRVVRRRKKKAE